MTVVGNSYLKNVHRGFIKVDFYEKEETVIPHYILQVDSCYSSVCMTSNVDLAYKVYKSFCEALDSGAEKWFIPCFGDLTMLL